MLKIVPHFESMTRAELRDLADYCDIMAQRAKLQLALNRELETQTRASERQISLPNADLVLRQIRNDIAELEDEIPAEWRE